MVSTDVCAGIDAANQALDADGFFSSSYAGTLNLNLTAAGWIKTNHGQSGYYRVLYPKQFWAHLGDAILKQFSGTPVGYVLHETILQQQCPTFGLTRQPCLALHDSQK